MKSSSRNGAKVIWLAIHTTEGMMTAKGLRDWTSWAGSSHASSDDAGVLMTPADGFVPYDRAAWTLRNGNPISENIEQCGWAKWTRAEWLARPRLLEATARWLADRSKARGIPLVRLSAADIKARKPGVIGHGDYSTATGDGTHWDPGSGYPWDVVLGRATQLRDGIKPGAAPVSISEISKAETGPATTAQEDDVQLSDPIPNANPDTREKSPTTTVANVWQDVQANAAFAARNTAGLAALDRDLRADLSAKGRTIEALLALVAQQNGLSLDDVRHVLAEELAKGIDVQVSVSPSALTPSGE